MLPLINGEVKPDGITLDYMGNPGGVPRLFYEQEKFQRYDVSEMSLSEYLIFRSIKWPYCILPVFHNRNFSYTNIYVSRNSGIRQGHPEDLKGKSFGIGDYIQTLGLWTRGILQMEFGVKPEDMVWYQERGEHFSHTGTAAGLGLKIPVTLHYAKTDFNTMYLKGELDATSGDPRRGYASGLERRRADLPENVDIIPLFPDPKKESVRFFKKTGVYTPHHTTAVRESILVEYPWVAISLMEAFEESKKIAIERLRQRPPTLLVFGQHYLKELDDIFGPDILPYGIKANAKAIDMAQTFSVEQGLTKRKQPLDEMFPQEVIYREERLP